MERKEAEQMNCGPAAVAKLTGRPFKEVLGRFEWVCEQQTRKKSRRNGSGTTLNECRLVLNWYGFDIAQPEANRRTKLGEWARQHRVGFWLMLQPGHWFALRGRKDIRRQARRIPAAPITGWYRVERRSG